MRQAGLGYPFLKRMIMPLWGLGQHVRPPVGMAGACRGGACGRRQHPRLDHKGQLPAARLQGAAPQPGLPPTRSAAPAGAAPAQGGTARMAAHAHSDGVQHRRLRKSATVAQ
ncbi:hypothetical protein BHM03_00029861 [Ensete ventricosum]|nr:hypothetical protein BHM03_00029861 [Ensete ventricosum]